MSLRVKRPQINLNGKTAENSIRDEENIAFETFTHKLKLWKSGKNTKPFLTN